MLLLSTGSLRYYELDRVFEIARDTGFDGIELIVDERWDTTDPVYLKRLIRRYGLPIPSLHTPFGFVETPAWGKDPAERMRRSITLAGEIGAQVAVIHLPFFAERRYARWVMEELPQLQQRTGIKLAVENMPHAYKILGWLGVPLGTGSFYGVDRGKWYNRMLRPVSTPCFPYNYDQAISTCDYLVFDTTHLATGGRDPFEVFDLMKPNLVLIHVSNFDGREHQPLLNGSIDMPRFLRHVKENGYTGLITLELMPEYFPDLTECSARDILSEDLSVLRKYFPAEIDSASTP